MQYVTEADWIVTQSEWFYLLSVAFFMFFAGLIVGLMIITLANNRNAVEELSDKEIVDNAVSAGMAYHEGYTVGLSSNYLPNPYNADCDEWALWGLGYDHGRLKSRKGCV